MPQSTLPEQMKAQLLEEFNTPYQYRDYPIPEIASQDQMLVKVDAAGYCHTDAVLVAGHRVGDPAQLPHIGSHEFAGTVIARSDSPSEAASEFPVGTRVGVPGRGFGACGSCFECRDPARDQVGYSFFCPKTKSNGLSKDGGFAEYAVVDARQCVRLPDEMHALDAAPLMCAGITIYNAIKNCNLEPGQRLGIMGCGGGLGHLGLQFADALQLRVVGVDAGDRPLELARSLGTSAYIVDARSMPPEDVVRKLGEEDGRADAADMGLDAVIILPESQAGFDYGVKMLRNHGLCLVVSIPVDGFRVSAWDLVFRDIRVKGSMLGTHEVLKETISLAAKHNIKPVKKSFALSKLNDLVDEYHKGFGGRLIVDMSL